MNIVLDGLSGVGKTYIGEKLAEKLNIEFLEFNVPPINESETDIHENICSRMCLSKDTVILETSHIMSWFTKRWMYENKIISLKELLTCKQMSMDTELHMPPTIIIFITDEPNNISARVTSRSRPFEYKPNIDMLSLNDYLMDHYIKHLYKIRLSNKIKTPLNFIVYSRTNKTEEEILDDLENIIYKLSLTVY